MSNYFSEFAVQEPAINQLRYKIRYAKEENNPSLLSLWFSMEDSVTNNNSLECWKLYCAQFKLLIDTLSDDLLPQHWRMNCLNNIYKPLCSLQRIAISSDQLKHLNQLYYELRVVSNFFQNGLSA